MNLTLVFYVPAAIVALSWLVLLLRSRAEFKQTTLWLTFALTALAVLAALWAMLHRPQLRSRSFTDYRYEILALFFSLAGFVAAIVWSPPAQRWFRWLMALCMAWLAFLWLVIMTTNNA